jgi:excisionase family DNA binding protein
MQPTPNARRRVAAAAPAAPVAGAGLPALPVLRFVMANGLLEIADAPLVQQLLQNEQRQRLAAEAEQAALSVVYRLSGAPDASRPYGGLLTQRLDISKRTAYSLINEGRLKYTCLGRKAYRVSEAAVRELLGDKPPA